MRRQPLRTRTYQPTTHLVNDYVTGSRRRRLESLPWDSKAPVAPWWERPDPYWETTVFGGHRKWRRPRSGTGESTGEEFPFPVSDPGHAEREPTIALSEVPVSDYGHFVGLLRLVGVIATEQVAAITGDKKARNKLRKLGAAGVVECAWFHNPGAGFPQIEMWRIRSGNRYAAYAQQICAVPLLQRQIFCGLSPFGALPGVLHARHQTLATEAMLRTLEAGGPWFGWLPEAVCVPNRFLPPKHPHLPAERAAAAKMLQFRKRAKPRILSGLAPDDDIDQVSVRADGCLVRFDGHKVFLEVQSTSSPESVLRKVANWSRLLDSGPFGGIVLFVAAPKPAALPSVVQEIKDCIASEASRESRSSLLVASWPDWSPDHGVLTEDCRELRAARYVDGGWQETTAASVEVAGALPDWQLLSRVPDLKVSPPWLVG